MGFSQLQHCVQGLCPHFTEEETEPQIMFKRKMSQMFSGMKLPWTPSLSRGTLEMENKTEVTPMPTPRLILWPLHCPCPSGRALHPPPTLSLPSLAIPSLSPPDTSWPQHMDPRSLLPGLSRTQANPSPPVHAAGPPPGASIRGAEDLPRGQTERPGKAHSLNKSQAFESQGE